MAQATSNPQPAEPIGVQITPPDEAKVQRRCWVEVDLAALRHNAAVAADLAGHPVMAVIKANGYGHGAVEVARALEREPSIAGLGVACLDEAGTLRQAGITAPVFLLGACLPTERPDAVAAGFNVIISDLAEAADFNRLAVRQGVRVACHLAIDTGMGRLGLLGEAWDEDWMRRLLALPNLDLVGFASHLPSADEDPDFTTRQARGFRELVGRARKVAPGLTHIHLSNSAGIMTMGAALADFCTLSRAGLMLYGVAPVTAHSGRLRPVLGWHSRVTLVRELPAGHGVSYGRTHVTPRPTRVATLGVGYGDGYPRHLSASGAAVLIRGRRCPLLGRVTMDQIMVDVTDLPRAVQPGDEAILLGCQRGERIDASELAAKAGTIPWEILTGISRRVVRVYQPRQCE